MIGETAQARVYRIICAAADQGASCPTDTQLCKATHYGLTAVRKAIADLIYQGRIARMNSDKTARVFFVADTGKQTAPHHPSSQGSRPLEQIIAICAKAAALTPADLRSPARLPIYNRPRIICYYIANKLGWSTVAIGRALGRDHGTVLSMIGTVEARIKKDWIFAMLLERTQKMIEQIDPYAPIHFPTPALKVEAADDLDEVSEASERRQMRIASTALLEAIRREHPDRLAA